MFVFCNGPDMTFAVDWTLKTNYISVLYVAYSIVQIGIVPWEIRVAFPPRKTSCDRVALPNVNEFLWCAQDDDTHHKFCPRSAVVVFNTLTGLLSQFVWLQPGQNNSSRGKKREKKAPTTGNSH